MHLAQFQPKSKLMELQKVVLSDNHFSQLFTEVKVWHRKSFKLGLGRFFKKIKCFQTKLCLFLTFGVFCRDIKN